MGLTGLTMIFAFLCFLLLFLKEPDAVTAGMAAGGPAAVWLVAKLIGGLFPSDRLLRSRRGVAGGEADRGPVPL